MHTIYTGIPAHMISIATPTNRGVVVNGNTTRNAQINKYNTGRRILTCDYVYRKIIRYPSIMNNTLPKHVYS